MDPNGFVATAWNKGRWHPTGASYGLKIPVEHRDRHFERHWETVTLRLIGERTSRVTQVNVAKKSFWDKTCRELIARELGHWFIENGFGRWPRGMPPRFRIHPLGCYKFEVRPDHRL
ncbi:MAG: hypothetical protein OXF98_07495 [Rhodospirillaceae bacterium]|nr:hypothetical protein [Rhodospirillaceae bacterium]